MEILPVAGVAIVVFGLAVMGMATGVMTTGRCLQGSCGGKPRLGPDGEEISCAGCPNRKRHGQDTGS